MCVPASLGVRAIRVRAIGVREGLTCRAFVGDCQHCPVEVPHQVFMVDAVSCQDIVKVGRHQRLVWQQQQQQSGNMPYMPS